MDEFTRFSDISLCTTSRLFTIPLDYKVLGTVTPSTEAAHHTFYCVCKRSSSINILEHLGPRPFSITLLATVTQQDKRGSDRPWNGQDSAWQYSTRCTPGVSRQRSNLPSPRRYSKNSVPMPAGFWKLWSSFSKLSTRGTSVRSNPLSLTPRKDLTNSMFSP